VVLLTTAGGLMCHHVIEFLLAGVVRFIRVQRGDRSGLCTVYTTADMLSLSLKLNHCLQSVVSVAC
jgi:hypothetical protein